MSARRTKSYAAAAVQDDDGVKTTFATAAAPVVLTVADWNGAAITAAGLLDLPRSITIARSSAANQYSVNPIVLTGVRGGATVTESIAQPNDDGNDTLRGTQAFDYLTRIDIPTNGGTAGSYKIGVQDICAHQGERFQSVKLHAAGTLNVSFSDSAGAGSDAIPLASGERDEVGASRILTSTALSPATTVGLTVYMA